MRLFGLVILSGLVGGSVALSVAIDRKAQVRAKDALAEQQEKVENLARLSAEHTHLSNLVAQVESHSLLSEKELRELLALRNEVGQLRQACGERTRLEVKNAQLLSAEAVTSKQLAEAQAAPNYWPKEQLMFAGFADPESAMKSLLWAMSTGKASSWRQSCTPEAIEKLEDQWAARGASDQQREAETQIMANALTSPSAGFHIVEQRLVSTNRAVVTLSFDGEGKMRKFALRKVGNDWKLDEIFFAGDPGPD